MDQSVSFRVKGRGPPFISTCLSRAANRRQKRTWSPNHRSAEMRTIHNALRYVFLILLAAALAVTGGCKKKTPQVPPPQAQAPTATPAAQPPAQPPAETQPSTSSAPATTTGGVTAATTEKPSETTAPSKPSPSVGHNGR